jgi:hypothetical protein
MDFQNLNQCFSTTQTFGGLSAIPLSSYPCTEVYIFNHAATDAFIFSQDGFNILSTTASLSTTAPSISGLFINGLYFRLQTLADVTIRGITNSNQISAFIAGGSGNSGQLSYRAQFFSSNPLNTY